MGELERLTGGVGVEDELDEAGAVAQVDEDQAAVVAAAVDPAGDPHLGVDPVGEHLAAPGVAVGIRARRRHSERPAGLARHLVDQVRGVDRALLAARHVAQLHAAVSLEDHHRRAPIRSACLSWPLRLRPASSVSAESPAWRSSATSASARCRSASSTTARNASRRPAPPSGAQRQQDPLDPGRPADRRGRRPAELLDQPVVAPAAADLRLGAEPSQTKEKIVRV